jgi:formate dehydrogenase major subunit
VRKGEQVPTFAVLQADGSTACGCWIFAGSWTQAGNQMARRDASDPSGLGVTPNWAWSWPANRRVLYNRASCNADGVPYISTRKLVWWNGTKWVGNDVPDFKADSAPADGMNPFIMNGEGVARLWAPAMADGPFPEHYEPFDSPLAKNPFGKVLFNPAARVFPDDWKSAGKPEEFPFVATTYRLTEHFHFWTKNARIPAILQPEAFVELPEGLARKKGIRNEDWVLVKSKRGQIKLKALVTKRMPTLKVDGNDVEVVGLPIHWGFIGQTRKGYITNTLTPPVGDANIQTPEYKAFLVNVEKA